MGALRPPVTVLRRPFWRERGAPEAWGTQAGGRMPACWQLAAADPGRQGGGGGPACKQGRQHSLGAPPSLRYNFPSWSGLLGSRGPGGGRHGVRVKWLSQKQSWGSGSGHPTLPWKVGFLFLRSVEIPSLDSCLTSLLSRAGPTRTSCNGKAQWVPHGDPEPPPPGASASEVGVRRQTAPLRALLSLATEDTEALTASWVQFWAGRGVRPRA